jgi:hypothetical protein
VRNAAASVENFLSEGTAGRHVDFHVEKLVAVSLGVSLQSARERNFASIDVVRFGGAWAQRADCIGGRLVTERELSHAAITQEQREPPKLAVKHDARYLCGCWHSAS